MSLSNVEESDTKSLKVEINMTSLNEEPSARDSPSGESPTVDVQVEKKNADENLDTVSVTDTVSSSEELGVISSREDHDDKESINSHQLMSSTNVTIAQSYVGEETSTSLENNGGLERQEGGEVLDDDDVDNRLVTSYEGKEDETASTDVISNSLTTDYHRDENEVEPVGLYEYGQQTEKGEDGEGEKYNVDAIFVGIEPDEADLVFSSRDDSPQVEDIQDHEYLTLETSSYSVVVAPEDLTEDVTQVSSYSVAATPTSPQSSNELNSTSSNGQQKVSASTGKFVLRNARHEDARDFMQHVRQLASQRSALNRTEQEKMDLFTILRSTNKSDTADAQSKNRISLQSFITNDLVQQFEKNSVGGSAVFPSSKSQPSLAPRSISIDSTLELSTPLSTEPLDFGASKQRAELSKQGSLANRRRPSRASVLGSTGQAADNNNNRTESTDGQEQTFSISPVITSPSAPKTNESLARELEEKIKIKALIREKLEQRAREQQELLITNKKEGKLLYENKSQSEDGESTVRPSQLVQRTVSGGEANEATLPSWQMALREKNKTKRASMGETQRNPSLTSPKGDSPQSTPPWVVEVERRKLRLSSSAEPGRVEVTALK